MDRNILCKIFFASALIAALLISSSAMAEVMTPKVDNFIILQDASGSMGAEFGETDKTKMELAKESLLKMNARIPELGYEAGLFTLAPFKEYYPMSPYSDSAYAKAINNIDTDVRWGIFGHPTPLGEGMMDILPVLDKLSGPTAIILVSDGASNMGEAPLAAAKSIIDKYDVCFHVISFATSAGDEKVLNDIASLKDCSVAVKGADLEDDAKLNQFVQDVFFLEEPDSDGDGVYDSVDACPNTPSGVLVNSQGCAPDADGDGVPDYADHCPHTPAGVLVNSQGCAPDADGDGVPDYKDECPNTPKGSKVDAKGCGITMSIILEIAFDTNKANIKPRYDGELAEFAKIMKANPGVNVEIQGYTDNVGSAEYNRKLSQRRADSVVNALINKYGIAADRLSAVGYGEVNPIATNKTAAGRAENRRIEAKIDGVFEAE